MPHEQSDLILRQLTDNTHSPAARIGFLVTTGDSEGEFPNRFVNNLVNSVRLCIVSFAGSLQVDSKRFILPALAYEANRHIICDYVFNC